MPVVAALVGLAVCTAALVGMAVRAAFIPSTSTASILKATSCLTLMLHPTAFSLRSSDDILRLEKPKSSKNVRKLVPVTVLTKRDELMSIICLTTFSHGQCRGQHCALFGLAG